MHLRACERRWLLNPLLQVVAHVFYAPHLLPRHLMSCHGIRAIVWGAVHLLWHHFITLLIYPFVHYGQLLPGYR